MTSGAPLAYARTLIEARRHDDALRALAAHLASHPDDVEALCLAAQAQLELNRPAPALDLAQRAISLAPEYEWPLRLASVAHSRLAEPDAALAAARASVRADPGVYQTHTLLSQAIASHPAFDADPTFRMQAEQAVAVALDLAPNEPETHLAAGNLAMRVKDLDGARARFEQALALDPHYVDARHNLSLVAMRQRRLGSAAAGLVGVLAEGGDELALHNLKVLAARILRYLHLALWLIVLIASRVVGDNTQPGSRADHSGAQLWITRTGAVLAVLVIAGFAVTMRLTANRALGQFVRGVAARDRMLLGWAVALLGTAGCTVAAALVPVSAAQSCYLAAIGLLLVGMVLSWLRGRTLSRDLRRIRSRGG
ncbi:tetratricopeptide repeat protein [Jatrophihabitans telluris]|uniref:Tetratricopeptide repeat protein n=1 Tax=Jatrophihabitans telluris TaxID=2038343 RepID=A0ABY4QT22_9ACTN|nr:tetratricopeptide repeat protein [Jatrophihabitans telluris]UQX86648.1 tetratricopeptide repeat protein [Jatrophihabitans telluris]